jgi:hypothetical protein
LGVFNKEGAPLKEERFDPGVRGGFWTIGHLGFLCRASTIIPSVFGERFTCHLIFWSLARVGREGGCTVEIDLVSLEGQIFIFQPETSPGGLPNPDLHFQSIA